MPDFEANPGSSSNPANLIQEKRPKPAHVQHIWIVTGPAGCGKSTVGNGLRIELGVPFLEGDDVRCVAQWFLEPLQSNLKQRTSRN
jgi:gluconokinase